MGSTNRAPTTPSGLALDRVLLPADEHTRMLLRCETPSATREVRKAKSRANCAELGVTRFTTVTAAWTIAKTAGEISKKLYEFAKNLKDREAKQQVEEILDKIRELKQSASELEDENRELREKLRFKSDEYEFRNPFWYHKAVNPDQPLCPKCFARHIPAPMGEPGQGCTDDYRCCLVCGNFVEVSRHRRESRGGSIPQRGGQWS